MEKNGNLKNEMNASNENKQPVEKLSEKLKNIIPLVERYEKNTGDIKNRLQVLKEKIEKLEEEAKNKENTLDGRLASVEKHLANNTIAKEDLKKVTNELNEIKKEVGQKSTKEDVEEKINYEINTLVDDLDAELENYANKEFLEKEYLKKEEANCNFLPRSKEEEFASKIFVEGLDYRTHLHDKLFLDVSNEIEGMKKKMKEIENEVNNMQVQIKETLSKTKELEPVVKFLEKIKEMFPGEEIK